jgi:outer membrane protein OmpA-like peptidoglycan-associated protein
MLRPITFMLVIVALGGCATERIVLLPQPDGKPSGIVVTTAQGRHEVSEAYAGLELKDSQIARRTFSEAEVQQRYGDLLAVPVRPVSHTLFFLNNSTALTEESRALMAEIARDLQSYPEVEIRVIGHADTVGSDKANDALSVNRARVVRKLLLEAGVSEENILIAGHGKREPALPTADGVAEPRNRRVEITLR